MDKDSMIVSMSPTATIENQGEALSLETIDAALAELEGEEQQVEEQIVADEQHDDEVLAEAITEVEAETNNEARAAAYADQTSNVTIEPEKIEEAEAKKAKGKKVKAFSGSSKKSSGTGVVRTRGNVADLDPSHFILTVADAERDPAEVKKEVLASKPAAKKIAEKFENLLLAVSEGKAPSCYTVSAFKLLKEKGEFTSGELVKHLHEVDGYSIGTSRSQAQQMMTLLPVVKIAVKDGKKLRLNENSVLAQALDGILSGSAAPAPEKKESGEQPASA